MNTQTEAMKLALEALKESQTYNDSMEFHGRKNKAIAALRKALTEQPAQQCKWPTCQSEEYQQALAEQIKRELVDGQPAPGQQCMDHGECFGSKCIYPAPQPAQPDPVAKDNSNYRLDPPGLDQLCTSPPAQRKPLSLKEITEIDAEIMKSPRGYLTKFARAIEAAHGIKGDA